MTETERPGPRTDLVGVRRGMFGVTGSGDTSGYGRLRRDVTLPAGSARPYGGYFAGGVDAVAAALGEEVAAAALTQVVVFRDELTVDVHREHLVETMRVLRDEPALRFELCLGVSGVHFPQETGRELHAVYPLMSLTHNCRIRVQTTAPDADPWLPSLYSVYPTTDWHERETYDFFGIVFAGHPALTRIEMPDDWVGHPQRKDYPLGGIPVEYHGARIPPPDERRSYR